MRGKALRAAAVVIAALIFVPAAFAHHAVITASFSCDGTVSYTATAWATSSGLPGSRTNSDIRIFETAVNGTALNPTVQVGNGAFNTADNFTFSGTFTVDSTVSNVTLNAKEFAKWGDNAGTSGGTNVQSSITVARATTGCTPPPPPPPTDKCPNIDGVQSTVPDGMIVDANGNCVTPPPPAPPAPPTPPTATPTAVPPTSKPKAPKKPVVKHAKKKVVKAKVTVKKVKPKKHPKKHPKATQVRTPGVLPFTL